MRTQSNSIRLMDIRQHEGSQARAWEELAYQLRPLVGTGHLETRKTRAPDAGVEWYEVYEDGHEEGFQAKFHDCLSKALGGMRESVKAVCSKRPQLTKLTFVVPYDFTDSGNDGKKMDQDRWEDAVVGWKHDIRGADQIEFRLIRAGDILSELTREKHAGRRAYWFGELDLSDQWFSRQFEASCQVAGPRYTPEADSISSVNFIIDALLCGPDFRAAMKDCITSALNDCKRSPEIWEINRQQVNSHIAVLERDVKLLSSDMELSLVDMLADGGDFVCLENAVSALLKLVEEIVQPNTDLIEGRTGETLGAARRSLEALLDFLQGEAVQVLLRRSFALIGVAGQGKTHSLMRAVKQCRQRSWPALAILGQRLSDKNWWPAVSDVLDIESTRCEEFLQALDSLAEAHHCRGLVVIDALNESQVPERWRNELPVLLAQFQRYKHLALIVSYRSDYEEVVNASYSDRTGNSLAPLIRVSHPGFSGHESQAMRAYCELYEVKPPARGLFKPHLANPLFLRLYCESLADDPNLPHEKLTRSSLFSFYLQRQQKVVCEALSLSPGDGRQIITEAINLISACILEVRAQRISRSVIERPVNNLLPDRTKWPRTLFGQMLSAGIVECIPGGDDELVGFPFQAYSEYLLAERFMALLKVEFRQSGHGLDDVREWRHFMAERISQARWSWRTLAVSLPEKEGLELLDLLPEKRTDLRMRSAMSESFVDRDVVAFTDRTLELMTQCFADSFALTKDPGVSAILSLAACVAHPGNADWLHGYLLPLNMPERDALWSIRTYHVEKATPFLQLIGWIKELSTASDREEVRLAGMLFMWFLSSPNRFLRDNASKALVRCLCFDLNLAGEFVRRAQEINDPYIQERILTCVYGALLIAGDDNFEETKELFYVLEDWVRAGTLPVDVLARDSVRGIATWFKGKNLLPECDLSPFEPPYGSAAPVEPPSEEELKRNYGAIYDDEHNLQDLRAQIILNSCLEKHGDFSIYVIEDSVGCFTWLPLQDPLKVAPVVSETAPQIDAGWAGRWIADRAIGLGWTAARFGKFDRWLNADDSRRAHKKERFGKKYQWIALRELLARLADNFQFNDRLYPPSESYQGPWTWCGRDFDPTLPLAEHGDREQVCVITEEGGNWADWDLRAVDSSYSLDDWVVAEDDLPTPQEMFVTRDPAGRKWVAIQRYFSWSRDNVRFAGFLKRERDIYFLQSSWLTASGKGVELYEYIKSEGFARGSMPERMRPYGQYFGESSAAPIAIDQEAYVEPAFSDSFRDNRLRPRAAVEEHLQEGNVLDCSIDETLDIYIPTSELLGEARWVGYRAEWREGSETVAKVVNCSDVDRKHMVLLVEMDWLKSRLEQLRADIVIGVRGERGLVVQNSMGKNCAQRTDIYYVANMCCGSEAALDGMEGPILRAGGKFEPLQFE